MSEAVETGSNEPCRDSQHGRYRADIDGLRAIAVLVVVFFHAGFMLFSGGYIGVDVFFVVSGYLITSKIVGDLARGNFSFSRFYNGRIRRLAPAYILVSLVTLVAATVLLVPLDYKYYATSLSASYLSLSNVFFSMLSGGYFSPRMEEFPLLHTWSLAVEEQFYFIWPALLVACYRYLRPDVYRAVVVICFVALLLFSEHASHRTASAYFLLPYRAFELLLGVGIALTPTSKRLPRHIAEIATAIGLIMIFASAMVFTRASVFPGMNALLPSFGTALVIYAGANPGLFVTRVLSSRPLVVMGLASYSLYLWHWPILAFLRYVRIQLTPFVATAAICLSIGLALISWKFVELPFRGSIVFPFKRSLMRFVAIPACAAAIFATVVLVSDGLPQRFSPEIREVVASYSGEVDLSRDCSIRDQDEGDITFQSLVDKCSFGYGKNTSPQLLLMGDSHANHIKPFIETLAIDAGIGGVYHVQGGCSVEYGFTLSDRIDRAERSCIERNDTLLKMAGRFRYVVLASNWSLIYGESDFKKSLAKTVERVIDAGATPVVVKDVPSSHRDLSRCILFERLGWMSARQSCDIPLRDFMAVQGVVDRAIDEIQEKEMRLVVIDPKEILCDGDSCVTSIGNTALYRDSNHLNSVASSLLGRIYLGEFRNPFATTRSLSGVMPKR